MSTERKSAMKMAKGYEPCWTRAFKYRDVANVAEAYAAQECERLADALGKIAGCGCDGTLSMEQARCHQDDPCNSCIARSALSARAGK